VSSRMHRAIFPPLVPINQVTRLWSLFCSCQVASSGTFVRFGVNLSYHLAYVRRMFPSFFGIGCFRWIRKHPSSNISMVGEAEATADEIGQHHPAGVGVSVGLLAGRNHDGRRRGRTNQPGARPGNRATPRRNAERVPQGRGPPAGGVSPLPGSAWSGRPSPGIGRPFPRCAIVHRFRLPDRADFYNQWKPARH
jgi:hypothetical protein